MPDTLTSRLKLLKAAGTSLIKVKEQIADAYDIIDDSVGIWDCTAATRPVTNLYNGKLIREVDTGFILRYDLPSLTWKVLSTDNSPRGTIGYLASSTSPTVTVAASAILVSLTVPLIIGRRYKITHTTEYQCTVAASGPRADMGGTAGVPSSPVSYHFNFSASDFSFESMTAVWVAPSTGNFTFTQLLSTSTGTINHAAGQASILVEDIGV